MGLTETIELLLKAVKLNGYIIVSEFLNDTILKNFKIKDLIEEIEKNYNKELILDLKNTEIYSYNLVYNYFKLKLFKLLKNGNELDLYSDDFKEFKHNDLIRIFSLIDSEFFDYLLDKI